MKSDIEKIVLHIDDQRVECDPGTTIIEAADNIGIYIPRFCYHEKLSVVANCRMCLVEVKNAPKTLPACATPVANDMVVYTRSFKARQSQKAVMEFLLINHPLDCPICDQGGECELQDIAMGYGEGVSKYTKEKRAVYDEDLGPLVATDMTRCIHCTRCVRFGTEIAGISELGALNRGNHMNIGTYLKRGLKSELSGNVIDLCPVGALTSKPYRFNGRSWGFTQHTSVSPHDCVGSNTYIHSINNGNETEIMRVVPRKNDSINETWLSDRDRFAYEGIQHENRLKHPIIKKDGVWKQVSWTHAISYVADCIQQVINSKGADNLAALAHPSSTCEEFYLLQKWMRSLGCHNLDYRLKEVDFDDQLEFPYANNFDSSFEAIEAFKNITLLGANPRSDQPLLNHRVRKAVLAGSNCLRMDSHLDELNYKTTLDVLSSHQDWSKNLAQLTHAVYSIKGKSIPDTIKKHKPTKAIEQFAKALSKHKTGLIMVGRRIMHHPQASTLRRLLVTIANLIEHKICFISEGANATGAAKMGMLPFLGSKSGLNKTDMFNQSIGLFWLHQFEPKFDMSDFLHAQKKFDKSFVIACSHFDSSDLRAYADIILPTCTYAEMSGTFMNLMGTQQSFNAAIPAIGESKAGWKIIAAIAQTMQLEGFEYPHSKAVIEEFNDNAFDFSALPSKLPDQIESLNSEANWLDTSHPYSIDAILRHAKSLQAIANETNETIILNSDLAKQYKVENHQKVDIKFGQNKLTAKILIDDNAAENTLLLPHILATHIPKHCKIEMRARHDT